jgi:hypothetical protein
MGEERLLFRERFPAGGFILISVTELCVLWAAFRAGKIQLRDLRAWLACREMCARRCTNASSRTPHYAITELQRLVGGAGGKQLEVSLRRLERQKLLAWSQSSITFAVDMEQLDADVRERAEVMLASIANRGRTIPLPRRIVRYIAAGAGRTLAATVFAHLIRCLYGDASGCRPVGTCKASWVANVFGVNGRAVKRARSQLVASGWLTPVASQHWHRNRYGLRVAVNLEWQHAASEREKSPRLRLSTTEKSPPDSNKKLLSEYKNQKPASGGSPGFCWKEGTVAKPNLGNVQLADLNSAKRLTELFVQARALGMVQGSESERLSFFAAAEHALAVATRNPPGLFSSLVRRGLWHFCTQTDEDGARKKLAGLRDAEADRKQTRSNHAGESVQTIVGVVLDAWSREQTCRNRMAA